MSSGLPYYPPTIFFNDINFNNDFYNIPNNNQGMSLAYANTRCNGKFKCGSTTIEWN